MTATTAILPTMPPRPALVPAVPARRAPPRREFGTGYGRSSGYAAPRAYAGATSMVAFRLG